MFEIREAGFDEKQIINSVVDIHVATFQGFFLTFMGKGFLRQLYFSFCKHSESGLLVAMENEKTIGFLAYSSDYSALFKYMIKTRLIPFAWYSLGAFVKKPQVLTRLVRAFLKPSETKRAEKYVELSSIGVHPDNKGRNVGTKLVDVLKQKVDFLKYEYITLETDADNNSVAIHFYEKNGFVREREFFTTEGRRMYEYRFRRTI